MKTLQPFQQKKTPLLPVAIILVSLFVAFYFTYDVFQEYQSKWEEYATVIEEQKNMQKTLDALNLVRDQTQSGKSEIQKYIQEFREDIIYDKVFSTVGTDGKIWAISIDSGEMLTSGLSLANIQFTLDVQELSNLLAFLDRATDTNGQQRFLIQSLSFPYSSSNTSLISATIRLGMYTIK